MITSIKTFEDTLRTWYENPTASDSVDVADTGYDAIRKQRFIVDGLFLDVTIKGTECSSGLTKQIIRIERGTAAANCSPEEYELLTQVSNRAQKVFLDVYEESDGIEMRAYQAVETSLGDFSTELRAQIKDLPFHSTWRYKLRFSGDESYKVTVDIDRGVCDSATRPICLVSVYWAASEKNDREKACHEEILTQISSVIEMHRHLYDMHLLVEPGFKPC